jgi:hypothetical protein
MILYYAIGGGLGHLARARRVLTLLGLRNRAAIVTASPDARVTEEIAVIQAPRDRHALRPFVESLGAERIIVDAFPCGLFGELRGIALPLDHVARLLREPPAHMPPFETTYVVEPLPAWHRAMLAGRVVELDFSATVEIATAAEMDEWLVVHSGPAEEIEELVAYARELQRIERVDAPIVVATRTFPIAPLLASASRIVSAAGFNLMLETEPWRAKHRVLPLPRRFDDQFARAARRRTIAAGA